MSSELTDAILSCSQYTTPELEKFLEFTQSKNHNNVYFGSYETSSPLVISFNYTSDEHPSDFNLTGALYRDIERPLLWLIKGYAFNRGDRVLLSFNEFPFQEKNLPVHPTMAYVGQKEGDMIEGNSISTSHQYVPREWSLNKMDLF